MIDGDARQEIMKSAADAGWRTVEHKVADAIAGILGSPVGVDDLQGMLVSKRLVVHRFEKSHLSVFYLDGKEVITCKDPVMKADGLSIVVSVETAAPVRS